MVETYLIAKSEISVEVVDNVGKEVFQSYRKILPKFNVDELEESDSSTETTMSKSPREFMVPEWASGEDIEKYITKLELAKEMTLFETDKLLIFYSLTRSERQDVITTLTEDQKTKLDDFIEFLRETFGPTIGEKRSIFENIKQNEEESIAEYFKRVELSYFRSKGIPVPQTLESHQQ